MKHGNYAVLDCETGGLNPLANPITQIAIIVLHRETLEEITRWSTFVKPYGGLEILDVAIKKTTVTYNDIKKGLDVFEVVERMIELLNLKEVRALNRGKVKNMHAPMIVGHNVTFDIGFIKQLFIHAKREKAFYDTFANNNGEIDYADTMKMAKHAWDGQLPKNAKKGINLSDSCERVGIKLVGAHGAMADTQATAELFKFFVNLMRGTANIKVVQENKEKSRKSFNF